MHRNMVTLLYQETATHIELEDIDKFCQLSGGGTVRVRPEQQDSQATWVRGTAGKGHSEMRLEMRGTTEALKGHQMGTTESFGAGSRRKGMFFPIFKECATSRL